MHKHLNFENKRAKRVGYKKKYGQFFSKKSDFLNFVARKLEKNRQNRKLHSKTSSSNFYQYFPLRLLG